MTYPDIPDLPPAPLRSQPEEQYAATASTFVGAMNAWGQAINTAGAWIQATLATMLGYKNAAQQAVTDAGDQVTAATTQAGLAFSSATAASGFAGDAAGYANAADSYAQVAAATANFKGEWSALSGALAIPASVYHDGSYWQLLKNLANVAASEPGSTGDWIGTETEVETWTSVSASATLAPGGRYRLDFPGSAITLTLPSVAANNTLIKLYVSSGSSIGSQINSTLPIMGQPAPMVFDTNFTSIDLISNGSEWRIK